MNQSDALKNHFTFHFLIPTCYTNSEKNISGIMKTDFVIAVNESFKLELISNPTTGYKWEWTNKQHVSIVDTYDFEFIPDAPVLNGSAGKEIWKFKGLKTGTDSIKLEYRRSWEPNSTIQTRDIAVTVK